MPFIRCIVIFTITTSTTATTTSIVLSPASSVGYSFPFRCERDVALIKPIFPDVNAWNLT